MRYCTRVNILKNWAYEITYLDVDGDGFVSPEALEKAIREDTILVSIMMVNNESRHDRAHQRSWRQWRRQARRAFPHRRCTGVWAMSRSM